jgi:hypothetical protein
MATAGDLTSEGAAAAQAGEREKAAELFRQATDVDPTYEMAWLWRCTVATTDDERRFFLQQALIANPESEVATRGLAVLRACRLAAPHYERPAAQGAKHLLRSRSLACSDHTPRDPSLRPHAGPRRRYWPLPAACRLPYRARQERRAGRAPGGRPHPTSGSGTRGRATPRGARCCASTFPPHHGRPAGDDHQRVPAPLRRDRRGRLGAALAPGRSALTAWPGIVVWAASYRSGETNGDSHLDQPAEEAPQPAGLAPGVRSRARVAKMEETDLPL